MAVNPSIQLGTSGNWAIKEDNLLAYKQLGNKFFDREFDFSRGTRATFVGRNGLIQESGLTDTELVTNGDFATDSGWSKTNATISNGLATITVTNGGFSALTQGITYATGKKYIITAQIQGLSSSSGKQIKFQDRGNNTGGLNTSNGLITLDETLQNIEISWTANSNSDTIVIARQSNIGDYSFTIDNVSIKEIQLDVPRIDFTDDPTGHLLLEPQSTNLVPYSSDFSSLNIRSNAVVTSNQIISPSGLLDADEITFDGTGTGRVEASISATVGQPYTISLYLKNKDLSDVTQVWIGFSASAQGQFVTITDEWQRYDITTNADGTTEYPRIQFSGTGSLYAWGFQTEQQSYATSYIPTSGSAVTRNQETCNNSGTVNDFNSEEGVLYAEYKIGGDSTDNYQIISLRDTSTVTPQDLVIGIGKQSYSNDIFIRLTIGSVNVFNNLSATPIDGYNKVAISYKSGNSSAWVNGTKVHSSSSTFTPSLTLSKLSFQWTSPNSLNFFGKTKDLKVFKRALTDAELQELTT